MTVLDYYGSTLALSVIVVWSEKSTVMAIGWILLMNILGSPFACAYIVYRLYMHQTLMLGSRKVGSVNVRGHCRAAAK